MDAKFITIANKLAKKDSVTGLDVWYKTVIENVPYRIERITAVNGTVVSVGHIINILIPFSDKYLKYRDWVNSENRAEHYTISQGDYIFIDIEPEEDITANNIIKLKDKYSPDVYKVSSVTEVEQRYGVKYQLKVEAT